MAALSQVVTRRTFGFPFTEARAVLRGYGSGSELAAAGR